ncbi:hypothetical protein SAMN05192546_104229 [Tindallia californiensis]|uniref:Uncharacterized protein n=1 Tax=Tindallia californiensis TaxID=159292 RepID=A0A1H3MRJ0_9FIRM|nr:hypothetical protein SAMN05192546_104229 [Tindallia californiensis]
MIKVLVAISLTLLMILVVFLYYRSFMKEYPEIQEQEERG